MIKPYVVEKDGKRYMYRATSHYSPEKRGPVADTEYMGRIGTDGKLVPKRGYLYNESTGEFGPVAKQEPRPGSNSVLRCSQYGNVYLLDAIQKRMGILSDLEASFGMNMGRTIMAAAMAHTIEPSALMHIGSVAERCHIREIIGIPADTDLSSPRMSELTATIGGSVGELDEFFRRRMSCSNGQFIFDLTSENTYSVKNRMAEWGHNRDRVPLRQVNLGLVTDTRGIPQMFYLLPGSVSDVTTLKRFTHDAKRLGCEDGTFILDRGFESPGNLMYLLDNDMDFIMPMAIGDNPVMRSLITSILPCIGDVKHRKVLDGKVYTVLERQMGIRRCKGKNIKKRITTWEDPDGYDMILDSDPEFSECKHILDVVVFHDRLSAAEEVSRMDIALESIRTELEGSRPRDPKKMFESKAGQYANLMEWRVEDGVMHVDIRQNAHTFASNRKGVFIMASPSGKRTWDGMLKGYECRDSIEDAFFEDKTEGDGRILRTGDPVTGVGRTLIRMVALMMRMYMLRRTKEYANDKNIDPKLKPRSITKRGPTSLLASLGNVNIVCGTGWERLTEVTKDCRLIFKMFDVGPPKGIDRS